jgi:hypothetical protein
MAEGKDRDWVDTISKLLIPIMIFGVGLYFSYQKDKSDRANQQFERESGILKLAASSNEAEKSLGLKIIEILQKKGKLSDDMRQVVDAISKGRPSDASTQAALNILATASKQDAATATQTGTPAKTQPPTVYLQIAREDQRAEAGELRDQLQRLGFTAPGVELVRRGTVNTYVRYFSPDDKLQADKILQVMNEMKFNAEEQNFTRLNQSGTSSGQLEVWIGDKHVAPPEP